MTYEKLLDMVDVKEVDGVLYGELKITLEGSMPYITDDGIRVPWEIAKHEMSMWICGPIAEAFEE